MYKINIKNIADYFIFQNRKALKKLDLLRNYYLMKQLNKKK